LPEHTAKRTGDHAPPPAGRHAFLVPVKVRWYLRATHTYGKCVHAFPAPGAGSQGHEKDLGPSRAHASLYPSFGARMNHEERKIAADKIRTLSLPKKKKKLLPFRGDGEQDSDVHRPPAA
jgi:hypothetical protein